MQCCYICIVPIVGLCVGGGGGGVECQGFDIPMQTWQCNVKHDILQGRTALVLPACCPQVVGVIYTCSRELLVEKLKSLPFHRAGGGRGYK